MKTYRLLETQLGMFLEYNRNREAKQYSFSYLHKLPSWVDIVKLEQCIKSFVTAHEIFRARFVEEEGEVRQYESTEEVPFEHLTMSEAEAEAFLATLPQPIDIFKEPGVRFTFITLPEGGGYLIANFLHLLGDGSSVTAMNKYVSALYNGEQPQLIVHSYFDYAEREAKSFESEEYRAAAQAAQEKFAGHTMTSVTEPAAANDAQPINFNDQLHFATAAIDEFCATSKIPQHLFFMGVFARTLALYANEQDVMYYTVNHARHTDEERMLQGLMVRTVPVLNHIDGNASLRDFLQSMKLHKAGIYPFTHFCRDLGITENGWGFVYQVGTLQPDLVLNGKKLQGLLLGSGGAGALPTVQLRKNENEYILDLTTENTFYSAPFLRGFMERFVIIAQNFAAASAEAKLNTIPVITPDEAELVLTTSMGDELEYDHAQTFIDMFREQVTARPDAIALVDAQQQLTYAEVEARSNKLAAQLVDCGVKPNEFVGVMLPRTVEFMVAVIAVQKCGAGYVPMDMDYPPERLAYMQENSRAKVIIKHDGKQLYLERTTAPEGEKQTVPKGNLPDENFASRATPATPAYMIYTSGSTGKPKGVVLPNRALTAMLAWCCRDLDIRPGKVNLSITNFSFDASVPDLFPPLAKGGTLHIISEQERKDLEFVHDYAVKVSATGLTTSTQLGLALINTYPDLPLEYMLLGGEKMMPFAHTNVRVINGYGPTEFAVCSSFHEVDQSRNYDIPIGRAVPNSYSLIVDKLGVLLPLGMVGELALAGEQIADGYWQLPEKTASVFVQPPFALDDYSRMYRTGDLARYNAEGELDFLGRIDFQVKLRGFRIEIGEIEHAAAAFSGVRAVAAEVKEVAGTKHLVLYYEGKVDPLALKDAMAKTLTSYMVPDFFVAMEVMPLTPNGKIDRRKLPLPEATDEPIVDAANQLEEQILAIAKSVIKQEKFGVLHDFNRLGLTSLGAMSLLAKLKKECSLVFTMSELTANPTVRALATLHASKTNVATVTPSKPRRPRRATYPMTENQRGIYSDWLLKPDSTQYNVPAVFKFPNVTGATLAEAAQKVFAAHPAFMARFIEKNGEIVMERRDELVIEVNTEELSSAPDDAFFTAQMRPFKPTDTLTRAKVFTHANNAYLFIDIHHTIFDGFSVGIFFNELTRALKGQPLEGEEYTLFDAALDERDYLESELVEEDDKWFERYIDGIESTEMATPDDAKGKSGSAGRIRTTIPSTVINQKSRECGVTASDWLLTAFTELLRRIGRSDDVMINFVTAGRTNAETEHTIGMFVKTLPLKGIKTANTFTETVKRMHKSVRGLIERERESFVRLSEKQGVKPNILFAFEGGIFELADGVEIIVPTTDTVKAPLSVIVNPTGERFELCLEYDQMLFSERDMQQLATMFGELALNAVTTDPLREIPLLNAKEQVEILALSKGEEIEYLAKNTFLSLFRGNVIARPFVPAVVDCERQLTYGELDVQSNSLAAELMRFGVKPGAFVGVMLPRRVGFITSVIAVQKCGAGYVPMDADYPVDRLAYMLENSAASVLITTRNLLAGKSLDYNGTIIFLDELVLTGEARAINLSAPELPAYMIYTSGSTGKPKGVVIPHRALMHMCSWVVAQHSIKPDCNIATHPSFSFDASVIDIFPTLSGGATLHIYDEELRKDLAGMRDYIIANRICGGTMSTQIGMTMLDTYPDLPMDYLIVGGEKLLPIAKTKVKICNGYGPTEFTVCSSLHIVDQTQEGAIPIGRAVPGTYSFIVDRYGHLLPRGFAGELALAGPQIADGYWQLPEKTASVFVPIPFSVPKYSRMYRTGDLARYNTECLLEYLGRLDFQVKLRGFRIEIGEIEHAASTFTGVNSVTAEVRDVAGAKHLVLYYNAEAQLNEVALKAHLAAQLTEYMVPDYFVFMAQMPLTPNGKINRKLLPTPEGEGAAVSEYVEPATDTERIIAECYASILKLEKFGATTDFFAAGGTSLIAIKVVVALQKVGLEVQYGDLFKYKTPRALAAFITGETPPNAAQTTSGTFDYAAYDYSAIDKFLMATPTELFDGFRRHSLGDVLLCGATGYLGIHVLRYLLETTDATVYALVRSKKSITAAKRLNSQYVYYFGERIPQRLLDRLAIIEGDITDADLTQKLKPLTIGTVFNCAALVKHYIADDLMDRINVGGVENLIALCAATGARLVHTSTYSVGGMIRNNSSAVLDERHLFVGQESDNDYVRTKFLAERAVLQATADGKIRGKIMRLGNLMGREEDGEFQMNVGANAFINSLKSYKALGAYPLENLVNVIEMSPIDRVAQAVCLLATTPDALCIFHPYNCYPLDMGAVIGAMNRRGYAVDWVSRSEFASRIDALRNDSARANELQGILHYTGHLLKDRRLTPAPNAWTTTVLYRLGFRWHPAEDNYLANFLDMLEGLAVFD